jgi:hypothetical protein
VKLIKIDDFSVTRHRTFYERADDDCTEVEGIIHLTIGNERVRRAFSLVEVDEIPLPTGWVDNYRFKLVLSTKDAIYVKTIESAVQRLDSIGRCVEDVVDIIDLWRIKQVCPII